jgi:hypothetical protein
MSLVFDYCVFYVRVPEEWGLEIDKVYIYTKTPKKGFDHLVPFLGAFDYESCNKHLQKLIDANAKEYKKDYVYPDDLIFCKNIRFGESLEKNALVEIHKYNVNEWRQHLFFYPATENPYKAYLVKELQTRLQQSNVPLFARGALYNWALLSVVGLLDENNHIIAGKEFKIDAGYKSHLLVADNDIQEMGVLAGGDDDALSFVSEAAQKRRVPIYFYDFGLARQASSEEGRMSLSPKQKVKAYAIDKYLKQMESDLKSAVEAGGVKRIAGARNAKPFSQDSVHDLYQQIKAVPEDKTMKALVTGPLFVGSSFTDRALLRFDF